MLCGEKDVGDSGKKNFSANLAQALSDCGPGQTTFL